MSTKLSALRHLPFLLLVGAVLLVPTGCAQTEADLDYQRDKPDTSDRDHSYHGWNNAN